MAWVGVGLHMMTLCNAIERTAVRINAGPEGRSSAHNADRLIAAIGNAGVVMLGEPSNGAGAAFTAKARLIQLVDEQLGFDVLVWESGLIDLERTEASLARDTPRGRPHGYHLRDVSGASVL